MSRESYNNYLQSVATTKIVTSDKKPSLLKAILATFTLSFVALLPVFIFVAGIVAIVSIFF